MTTMHTINVTFWVLMMYTSVTSSMRNMRFITMKKEYVNLGMGCFWKPQKIFDSTPGVIETYVGYTGKEIDANNSNSPPPTYKTVCAGDGHIEAVRVVYDDELISFDKILDIFWMNSDIQSMKTNIGSQYTSAIYASTSTQAEIVNRKLKELQQQKDDRVNYVTINKEKVFYLAENYHQKYETKQPIKLAVLLSVLGVDLIPHLPTEVYKLSALVTVGFIVYSLYELYFDNTGKVNGKLKTL